MTRKTLAIFALTACSPFSAPPGYEVRTYTDWRQYSQYSDQAGFGYALEAAKILLSRGETGILAGVRASWMPNERVYVWSSNGYMAAYSKENRLVHAGPTVAVRHHLSAGPIAPFVEFKNMLDVRLLQLTAPRGFGPTCIGPVNNQNCLTEDDFEESAENHLLIWRQALAVGLRIRLGGTFLLLSQGVRWDVTPARSENASPGSGPREIFFSSTSLGLSF